MTRGGETEESPQQESALGFTLLIAVVVLVVLTALVWFWTHPAPKAVRPASMTVRQITRLFPRVPVP